MKFDKLVKNIIDNSNQNLYTEGMKNKNIRAVEAFKKDFIKLMLKYEGIVVGNDSKDNLIVYEGMEREYLPTSYKEAVEYIQQNSL